MLHLHLVILQTLLSKAAFNWGIHSQRFIKLSGFCHFGLVYSWFCDRALTLPSCVVLCWAHVFEYARAARSLVYVLCFMLERGVRIPALLSCFRPSSVIVPTFPRPETRRWTKRTVIGCLTCQSTGLVGGAWPMNPAINSRPSAVGLKVRLRETRKMARVWPGWR